MKTFSHLSVLASSLLIISCATELEDPTKIDKNEVLKVSIIGLSNLKTNSTDSTVLVARIPRTAGHLDVSFKTTLGIFPKTASKEIKEYADSTLDNYRMAFVTFKPASDAGVAYVTVEVATQRRRISVAITN